MSITSLQLDRQSSRTQSTLRYDAQSAPCTDHPFETISQFFLTFYLFKMLEICHFGIYIDMAKHLLHPCCLKEK